MLQTVLPPRCRSWGWHLQGSSAMLFTLSSMWLTMDPTNPNLFMLCKSGISSLWGMPSMFCRSETREQYTLHMQDYLGYMLHTEGKLGEVDLCRYLIHSMQHQILACNGIQQHWPKALANDLSGSCGYIFIHCSNAIAYQCPLKLTIALNEVMQTVTLKAMAVLLTPFVSWEAEPLRRSFMHMHPVWVWEIEINRLL